MGSSFATKIYADRWYSLSTSDHSMGRPAKNGGVFGDAFDLYVFFEFQGNFNDAISDLKQRYANQKYDALTVKSEFLQENIFESGGEFSKPVIEIKNQVPEFGSFEDALAVLLKDKNNRCALDAAIAFYAEMPAIDKALAEVPLRIASGLSLATIRKAGHDILKEQREFEDMSHSEMADTILIDFQYKSDIPIGSMGKLFFYDKYTGIWRSNELKDLNVLVGRRFRDHNHAKRRSDYSGVGKLIYETVEDNDFFSNADVGICSADGFWKVGDNKIITVQHSKENAARFYLDVVPDFSDVPTLLISVLREAFIIARPSECEISQEEWDKEQSERADEQLRLEQNPIRLHRSLRR